MTQFAAYYVAHPGSPGIAMAAGEDREAVKASAKRRVRSFGITTGRVIVRNRDDLDAETFADLCALFDE